MAHKTELELGSFRNDTKMQKHTHSDSCLVRVLYADMLSHVYSVM